MKYKKLSDDTWWVEGWGAITLASPATTELENIELSMYHTVLVAICPECGTKWTDPHIVSAGTDPYLFCFKCREHLVLDMNARVLYACPLVNGEVLWPLQLMK